LSSGQNFIGASLLICYTILHVTTTGA
jgi:hypothetical protein